MIKLNFENLEEEDGVNLINYYSNMAIEYKHDAYNMANVKLVFNEIMRRFKICKQWEMQTCKNSAETAKVSKKWKIFRKMLGLDAKIAQK